MHKSIQQSNRNLVKLFRYLKVRVIIIQKQMIHYISLCVFTWCTYNMHHHSRSFRAMVDWKICFNVTINNLGLKQSKLPMPSSPLYLTCSTCSCVTLKTYKDSKSRTMKRIRSFLRSRCLTLLPISSIFIGGSFLNFVLLYERILCLEALVKRNLHAAVPEANSFSVILV